MRSNARSEAAARPFGRRLADARGGRLPVSVVTGFLGAGKTTLIRAAIATPAAAGTAVLVNDYAAWGLDAALLEGAAEVVDLPGGCLCCSARDGTAAAVARVVDAVRAGAPDAPRRIVIETTGLADPAPVLALLTDGAGLGRDVHLAAVVTVVAAHALDAVVAEPEGRRQVALADRLVLSGADGLDQEGRAAALARLAAANPAAEVLSPGPDAFGIVFDEAPARPRHAASALHAGAPADAMVWEADAPLAWEPLAAALDMLRRALGPDLLRIKGVADIRGAAGPVLVQLVPPTASRPAELALWPAGPRATRLVVIGRALPQATVRAVLDAAVAFSDRSGVSARGDATGTNKSTPMTGEVAQC